MKKYIAFVASDIVDKEFYDFKNDDRTELLDNSMRNVNSCFLRIIRRLHLSGKICRFIDLPFKQIWSKSFGKIKLDENNEYYFIFPNGEINPVSASFFNKLKKKYNVHYILFVMDHWTHEVNNITRMYMKRMKFDYVLTINIDDAQKYGFIYHPVPYSVLPNSMQKKKECDLFFIGNEKNRLKILLDIYGFLRAQNVEMTYMISDVDNSEMTQDGIIYNKKIPYTECIEYVKASNCILEVLTPGQSGSSLRYYEAVCYNKKLLTNNVHVKEYPFYNPKYIHIFQSPHDIDYNWVKERIDVDYHYDGRYSPLHLIDDISCLEKNSTAKNKVL